MTSITVSETIGKLSAEFGKTKAAILSDPSQRPKPLLVNIANIPVALLDLRQWVIWRFEWCPKEKRIIALCGG